MNNNFGPEEKIAGTIVFQSAFAGSKSERDQAFLLTEDNLLRYIFFKDDNPFEQPTLKAYENQKVILSGSVDLRSRKFCVTSIESYPQEEEAE